MRAVRERILRALGARRDSVLQRAVSAAYRWERKALTWSRTTGGPTSPVRQSVGRLILEAAGWYYRYHFNRVLSPLDPLLPRSEFDTRTIVLAIGSLGPGGSERQLVTTVLGLQRTGSERLIVVCFNLQQPWRVFFMPTLQQAGIEVIDLSQSQASLSGLDAPSRERFERAFRVLPPLLHEVRKFALELLRLRPAVVHLWLDEVNCKAGIAALAVGVPQIVLSGRSVAPVHFDLYHAYMAVAYRLLLEDPRVMLLNNSEAGAKDYARWLGIDPSRITVIRNGIDFSALPEVATARAMGAEYRRKMGWNATTPVVGSILRFTEEKRPLLWIETALHLASQRPELRFLLIGDGPLRSDMQARISHFGVSDAFRLPGYDQAPSGALSAMDVLMLTSRQEGLPNVLIEAQALGIPVVVTDAGGARETFVPALTGELVANPEPESLANAVLKLLGTEAQSEVVRNSARATVRERFGVDRMISETRAAYGNGTAAASVTISRTAGESAFEDGGMRV